MLRPPCAACLRLQGPFTPAWAENIFVASSLKRYSKRRTDGKATPVAERFLKQNEFVEAVVRVSYAKHPDLVRYAKPPLFHRAAAAGREACAQANSSQTQMQPPPACLPTSLDISRLSHPTTVPFCLLVQPNLADKVERCMDEKFLPFSKHKGSQITNWFQQVCEKEALAFEN
jgi:hypothetical protein